MFFFVCAGHDGRVTDMTFNPAGKWLITSSMDSTVRTWDLLTGSLIDKLTVDQVINKSVIHCDWLVRLALTVIGL